MTLDQHVEQAKAEISAMAQKAKKDEINIKIGWFIRSDSQKRRYYNAEKLKQKEQMK